jgi:predicted small lipoprotein YifL
VNVQECETFLAGREIPAGGLFAISTVGFLGGFCTRSLELHRLERQNTPSVSPFLSSVHTFDEIDSMTALHSRRVLTLFCLVALLSMAGCGPKGSVINGKVVLPSGLKMADSDHLEVVLAPVDAAATGGGSAKVDPNNLTFKIAGGENKGVPAGNYKVSVNFQPYSKDTESLTRKKKFDEALAPFSAAKTQLTVQIAGTGEESITVDLEKKTVTK